MNELFLEDMARSRAAEIGEEVARSRVARELRAARKREGLGARAGEVRTLSERVRRLLYRSDIRKSSAREDSYQEVCCA